jgi:hypothetical protein
MAGIPMTMDTTSHSRPAPVSGAILPYPTVVMIANVEKIV